jgi:hypothetical protein
MAQQTISDGDKKLSEYIREIFEESFKAALPALERMEKMQKAYECQLPENWATYSQIYLPYIRTAVEQALPNVMNYLFPTSGMISLTPRAPMPYSAVQNVSDYLEDLVMKRISLKQNGLLTLKDAMKFNVGYGIVETEIVTAPEPVVNTIFGGQEPVEIRRMELGAPRETIKYNYVNWRLVVPTPDGDNPDDVTGVFHLVPMREDALKAMYALDASRENPVYKGNPEEIIRNVRADKCSMAHYPIWWIMNKFSGSSNVIKNIKILNEMNRIVVNEKAPVVVPILKCYFKNEHIWMAPDGTIIYHVKDDVQTLKCPIIRACPVPDGGNWFPVGDVEASRDAADGANVFKNALMDLLTRVLHPTTIVNRMVVQDDNVGMEPYGIINAFGKVGDAISYAQPPPLPNGIIGIGDDLENQMSIALGQPRQFQGQGTAGVMRGGGGAFESLLQTTMARSKLSGAVLEMGWLERVVDNVLILAQVLGLDDAYITKDDLSKSFIEKTITAADLRNSFMVSVNLDDKFRRTPSERAMELALYRDVIKQNPRFNWQAADEWILGDKELARRLRADEQTMQQQIQQMQQMAQTQEQQGGGLNPGEQAMDGSKNQIPEIAR